MTAGADGLAVVDKPAGWTSHDVVARARTLLGTRKVGHAGTLDPDATGVLLLGVGRVTRLLRFLSVMPKSYTGEVVLGVDTTTLDASGDIVASHDMSAVTVADARSAAGRFVGDIEQVPPMVSAVKVGGRRLHELARQGLEVERRARPVTVHRFDVTGVVDQAPTGPVLAVEVACSAGTYVRVLAADLGAALGGGAHLRNLRRVSVGPFSEEDARPLEEADLLPAAAAVAHLPRVEVDDELAAVVAHGRPLDPAGPVVFAGAGPWAVADGLDRLLAVYERSGSRVKPAVVMVQPGADGGG